METTQRTSKKASSPVARKRQGCTVSDGGSGVLAELLQNPCNIIILENSGTVVGNNTGTVTTCNGGTIVENSPNYGSTQTIGNRHTVDIDGSGNVGNGENIANVNGSGTMAADADIVKKLLDTIESQQQTIAEQQQAIKTLAGLLAERNREYKELVTPKN